MVAGKWTWGDFWRNCRSRNLGWEDVDPLGYRIGTPWFIFCFLGLLIYSEEGLGGVCGQSGSIYVSPDLDWFIWVARLLRVFFHSKKVIGNCAFDVDEEKINRKHATDLDDCMACDRWSTFCIFHNRNVPLV